MWVLATSRTKGFRVSYGTRVFSAALSLGRSFTIEAVVFFYFWVNVPDQDAIIIEGDGCRNFAHSHAVTGCH